MISKDPPFTLTSRSEYDQEGECSEDEDDEVEDNEEDEEERLRER